MAWLLISAGTGPEECHQAVKHMVNYVIQHHNGVECLDVVDARHGYMSALISGPQDVLQTYAGTIKWSCPSSIRKGWKRKNWFITCQLFEEEEQATELNMRDVKFETMRASGPGGQHVNKTESAVRATHIPSGLVSMAQEERSQHMNKKLAISRLVTIIREQEQNKHDTIKQNMWMTHNNLERGGENMCFKGINFKLA